MTGTILKRIAYSTLGAVWAAFTAAFVLTALRLTLDLSAGRMDLIALPASLVLMTSMLTAATLFSGPFWLTLAAASAVFEGLRALRAPALRLAPVIAGAAYGYVLSTVPTSGGLTPDTTEPLFQVVSWALGGVAYGWMSGERVKVGVGATGVI